MELDVITQLGAGTRVRVVRALRQEGRSDHLNRARVRVRARCRGRGRVRVREPTTQ